MCRPTRRRIRGRLLRLGEKSEDDAQSLHRGSGGSTYMKESARNTGSPTAWSGMTNRTPARDGPGAMGWRRGSVYRGSRVTPGGGRELGSRQWRRGVAERFVVPMKPGNAGGGKGPQFKSNARRGEGPGDWATYQLRTAFRNCRWRCTRKRRQNPATASTPSTTRSAARIFWRTPTPSAAPTRAWPSVDRQDFEAVEAYGVERWLKRTGACAQAGDLTDRTLSDAFSYRRPTANSGRWASQPCGIGSA